MHSSFPHFLFRDLRVLNSNRLKLLRPALTGLTIAVSVSVSVVLGLLLASADSVFASMFTFDIDLGSIPEHAIVIGIAVWAAAVVLSAASSEYQVEPTERGPVLGFIETVVIGGSIVMIYALFTLTQVVVWLGGADAVLRNAGTTYADHAREGFFQLLAVSVITLIILRFLRGARTTQRQKHWWSIVSTVAIGLTLTLESVALQRLFLYEDAYGFTLLRFYATAFAIWIGVVIVILGVGQWFRATDERFFGAAAAIGMVGLFLINGRFLYRRALR